MSDETITLPFKLPDMFGGFAEGRGLAKVTPAELTLEFVLKDSLLNVLKSGVKEIRIPQPEIDTVRFKSGWFGGKVHIRLKSMKWLADLPGSDSNEVILHIAKADRDRAERIVKVLTQA